MSEQTQSLSKTKTNKVALEKNAMLSDYVKHENMCVFGWQCKGGMQSFVQDVIRSYSPGALAPLHFSVLPATATDTELLYCNPPLF